MNLITIPKKFETYFFPSKFRVTGNKVFLSNVFTCEILCIAAHFFVVCHFSDSRLPAVWGYIPLSHKWSCYWQLEINNLRYAHRSYSSQQNVNDTRIVESSDITSRQCLSSVKRKWPSIKRYRWDCCRLVKAVSD